VRIFTGIALWTFFREVPRTICENCKTRTRLVFMFEEISSSFFEVVKKYAVLGLAVRNNAF
jgi:hypothetical protein